MDGFSTRPPGEPGELTLRGWHNSACDDGKTFVNSLDFLASTRYHCKNNDNVVVFMWPSATVIRVLKVTQRQLDYWEQVGLIRATGNEKRGSRELTRTGRLEQRLYDFNDIRVVKVVKKLRDAGLSLQKIQRAVNELRRRGKALKDVLVVTDGKRVEWIREDGRVQELLADGQLVFAAVALKRIEAELRKKLKIDKRGQPVKGRINRRVQAS